MGAPASIGRTSGRRLAAKSGYGLDITRASATTLTVATGSCRDDSDATDITVSSTLTIAITASGALGLNTGSEATSTFYAVWLGKGSSGVTAVLSASFTAPTMPAGFNTHKQRIGLAQNDSSGNLVLITNGPDGLQYFDLDSTDRLLLDNTAGSTSGEIDCSAFAPAGSNVWFNVIFNQSATGQTYSLGPDAFTAPTSRVDDGSGAIEVRQRVLIPVGSTQAVDWTLSATGARLRVQLLGIKAPLL